MFSSKEHDQGFLAGTKAYYPVRNITSFIVVFVMPCRIASGKILLKMFSEAACLEIHHKKLIGVLE